jgi:hypothetical protein
MSHGLTRMPRGSKPSQGMKAPTLISEMKPTLISEVNPILISEVKSALIRLVFV